MEDFTNKVDKLQQDEFQKILDESTSLQTISDRDTSRVYKNPVVVQRIVQLYVSGAYTNSQIGSIMGVNKRVIDRIIKKQEVMDMIIEYQEEEKKYIDARLKALRDKSIDTMYELLDSEEDTVRLNVAKDILDRSGHAVKKDNNLNVTVTYEQQLKDLSLGLDTSYIDTSYTVEDND